MRSFCLVVFSLISLTTVHAGDKKPFLLVVPPAGGKEVKLVDWRFAQGTRHMNLEDEKAKSKGPEYLEFREDKSTTFQEGILTLVPVASIKKIDYDREKKTVALTALTADDKELKLTGATRFIGINKITLEAEAILEGLGAATVKFKGGADDGLHNITFPSPKAVAQATGTPARVVAVDKEKSKHTALDLMPLYHVDGGHRVLPYLMFKKTVKVDMDKLIGLKFVPSEDKKKISYDYEVVLKDGAKHTLTLLTKIDVGTKKSATLEGLIGRVAAGYKLFPLHTIQELRIGDDK